jgi:hypothetical protein
MVLVREICVLKLTAEELVLYCSKAQMKLGSGNRLQMAGDGPLTVS